MVTGAEFVNAYTELGVDVTVVASRDRVLPYEDGDAARVLEESFAERGVQLVNNARAESVTRTDPLCTAAAFGLARAYLAEGDRAGAVTALETVSTSSVRFVQAQLAVAGVLAGDDQHPPHTDELRHAAGVIDGLKGLIDGLPAHKVAADFFVVAAQVVERDGQTAAAATDQLLGVEPSRSTT